MKEMEAVACLYCGTIRRREVFWEGAHITCKKCGAFGDMEYWRWRWSRVHIVINEELQKKFNDAVAEKWRI